MLPLRFESRSDLVFSVRMKLIFFPGKIELSDFCLSAYVLSAYLPHWVLFLCFQKFSSWMQLYLIFSYN